MDDIFHHIKSIVTMGGWISYFWPQKSAEFDVSPGLDEVESASGLTLRQKKVVTEIWDLVKIDIKQNGIDFFIEFFKAFPLNLNNFKAFQNMTDDQLRKSKKLEAHATNVMYAISTVVDNLQDVECLTELLSTIGRNHIKRKITPVQFDQVGITFIKFLENKLGSRITPFCRNAWEVTFKVMNSIIVAGLQSNDD
uniref:Globin domain-containing protein n=1 Tax=Strigamia maritima TaxID=126957 RepID=T1JI21_STRMM